MVCRDTCGPCVFPFKGQSWDYIKKGPILGWYVFHGGGAPVVLLTDNKLAY